MSLISSSSRTLALSIVAVFATGLSTTACNPVKDTGDTLKQTFNNDDPCSNNARNIGVVVGGIAGLLIGRNNSDNAGAIALAAAAGAGVGALIGNDIDNRRCELSKISKKYDVPIQAEPIKRSDLEQQPQTNQLPKQSDAVGLKVTMQDTGKQFESGSDQLTPDAKVYFTDIAKTYNPDSAATKDPKQQEQQRQLLKQRQVLIIGHTDDTGSSSFNADLAERRAKVVAEIFSANGVPRENLHYQGAGETQPIADNRTEAGRAKNRRAEIVELPSVVALENYLGQRKPVVAYYRTTNATAFMQPKVVPQPPKADKSKKETQVTAKNNVTNPVTTVKQALATTSSQWHFEGQPLIKTDASVSVGEVLPVNNKLSWIPFINTAIASEQDSVYASSCSVDHPRAVRGVKSLSTGKELEYKTSDYLPGMNNTAWKGIAGQHTVGLTGVAVARDGGAPVKNPVVLIYSGSQPANDAKPLAKLTTQANAYQGKNGVLYRVFVDDNSTPVSCIDIVLPTQAPFAANSGYLIHHESGQLYATAFTPNKI
ncbi:MAG: OmpA family protein [Thiotrichales bacterium]|jgi:outer membrane protein OmpA-like peptidoglycan-associated protein|nr:OmpA family protein [Thiotrichales bacterium]